MSGNFSKREPIVASDAFYMAADYGMFNETASQIRYDHQAVRAISEALRDMGQRRLISMNGGLREAMVSLVFYAGDGNLIKVMPTSFKGGDYPLQLPPVSERKVETDVRSYVIRTYPYIQSKEVSNNDVLLMKRTAEALGFEFNDGDDTPRNLMTLPDRDSTLVSIDADAFKTSRGGLNYGPDLYEQWLEYLSELFPAYKEGEISRQTNETDFTARMKYNRESGLARFDPLSQTPIQYIRNDQSPAPKRHWWDIFSGPTREQ
ncbi:MAG: hypothetical protein H6856_05250 [Rhodospirillales bacterium]|nr:hypothetical protein [Rhodospirillales bacterium]